MRKPQPGDLYMVAGTAYELFIILSDFTRVFYRIDGAKSHTTTPIADMMRWIENGDIIKVGGF